MTQTLAAPLPYSPHLEQAEKDEARTTAELIDTMRKISETVYRHSGHAMRSVHAKGHGLLHGELRVIEQLPGELRQGLFGQPGRYPVVMRLSTPPGDILPDSVSLPRGLAIKIIDVPGALLPESQGESVQDLVMVNAAAFLAPTAKAFLANLKLLAATTDKGENLKKGLSSVLRGTEKAVEALGGSSPKLIALGGHPQTHPLGETFFTQAPIRYGDYVAKLSVAPFSPNLRALAGARLDIDGKPDGLRAAVAEFFATQAAEWELRVQLCRDIASMPIEDASVAWPQEQSPYLAVARIRVEPQSTWNEAAAAEEDGLSFSPWHGLEAHRPLGAIMRARRPVYEASAQFRAQKNACPVSSAHADAHRMAEPQRITAARR